MKRSYFKTKPRKPMKKTPFKKKFIVSQFGNKPIKVDLYYGYPHPKLRKTRLRVVGDNDTALRKKEIQSLVREIVIARDKTCILRKIRLCGDKILQADHLITRSNSATFADTRLIVCICRSCHLWKKYNKEEYDSAVYNSLSNERRKLWDECQKFRSAHKTYKMDWGAEILNLKRELKAVI